jgi:hypothetical protein
MRFLLLILSIVISLQPTSWAMGMPMSPAHQKIGEGMQVDHVSTQSMVVIATDAREQCQENYDEKVLTGGLNQNGHLQDNNLPASCDSSPSATGLTTTVDAYPSPQYLDINYHVPHFSFQSRTESPEIRPPHNNIRL